MILNTMCFIWASNRILKSERAVHLVRCNKGRKPYAVHMQSGDSGSNHLFLQPLLSSLVRSILVHESTVRVFWRGGGGGGERRICSRQSLAKDGAVRSHVLHPVMKLDAFLINKQQIETKFFMQLPTRIYLTAALNFVTTHC